MIRRGGFTLIELTVALALAGAVVAIGYGAVEFAATRHQEERTRSEDVARGAAARRELLRWIAGAHVLPLAEGPPFHGIDGQSETDADDELSFLTTTATSVDARHTVVRLFVDRDTATDERGLVAELRQWLGVKREIVEVIELEGSVSSLDISYITGTGRERRRLRSWMSASLLPRAVELRFGGDDASAADLFRIPLVIALEGAR